MTDTHRSSAPSPARDAASAMDQALDWLIVLGSPSEEQTRQFHDWLAADPLHAEAFAKAQALAHVHAHPRSGTNGGPVIAL